METGFYFVMGNKGIFVTSNTTKRTDAIARKIIDIIGELRNVPKETLDRAKADKMTLDDIKRRTTAATLEHFETSKIEFYRISGKNFTENFPVDDFEKDIVCR